MSWKDKLSFIAPQFIEHEVQGTVLHFYPISVKNAFRIRSVAQPIARALTTLLTKNDGDQAQKIRTKLKDGKVEDQDIQTEAISKDLAELRSREKEKAVSDAVMVLFDSDNSAVIGTLLTDSLRDIFPRDISIQESKDFVDKMDITVLSEFLVGLAKANQKVLGPFAKRVGEAMTRSLADLRGEPLLPEDQEITG